MNRLNGKITEIKVDGALSQVVITISEGIEIRSIVIETPESAGYLKEGSAVELIFKETEVIISRESSHPISILNKIPGVVQEIKKGKILSEVVLSSAAGSIAAVISREAADNLALKLGDAVVAMVKQNEIMLAE